MRANFDFFLNHCFLYIFPIHAQCAVILFGFFSKIYDFLAGALTQNC